MASNMFMDALMEPGNKKANAKSAKKKVMFTAAKPLPTQSVIPSVMVGFYLFIHSVRYFPRNLINCF